MLIREQYHDDYNWQTANWQAVTPILSVNGQKPDEYGAVRVDIEAVRSKDLTTYTPKSYLKKAGMLIEQDGSVLPTINGTWVDVAYGDGVMVMIASDTNVAARKVDGGLWEAVTLPKSAEWTDICYGDGFFVAIASGSGAFAYSTDGDSWETFEDGYIPGIDWCSIAYGDGSFVAVHYGDTGFQGIVAGDPLSGFGVVNGPPAEKVIYANRKFWFIHSGVNEINCCTNPYFGDWQTYELPYAPTDIAYGDGLFVATCGIG